MTTPLTVISLIVAASDTGVIGQNGGLPWRLSADLRRFKTLTLGKPIVMGRRTFVSIGRPLPGRINMVISRNAGFAAEGVTVVPDLPSALAAAGPVAEVMVIGGAEIYALAMPQAQRLYLTRVHGEVRGDTHLRGFDLTQWRQLACEEVPADERNSHASSYGVFERRMIVS